MENNSFLPSISKTTSCNNNTSTTFANLRPPNMVYTQNSQFSNNVTTTNPSTLSTSIPQHFFLAQYLPPYSYQTMQFPITYPPEQQSGHTFAVYPANPFWLAQNGIENGAGIGEQAGSWFLQPNGAVKEQQRGVLDSHKTKFARIKRKLARQKSLSLQRNASSGASSSVPSSAHLDARKLTIYDADRDLYNFCTPDNKRLRVLLNKDLKNSDVGSLGRIVLPKREAEENLPSLSDKEGIQVVLRDVYSVQVWTLKFKYWSNNKSRMYVLENTGDFVKQNKLEIGDSLILYEDENKNLYFSIKKTERPAAEPSYKQQYSNHNYIHKPVMHQASDEEEANLALMIEQLKHREQQEAYYNLMTLPMEDASPHRQSGKANVEGSSNDIIVTDPGIHPDFATPPLSLGKAKNADDYQSVYDCYGGLDMLPDVNQYHFSL